MSVSPLCLVNGSSTINGVNVSSGSSTGIALFDDTGVATWSIICTSTDNANTVGGVNATLVVNQIAKTATYTQPSTLGSSLQFTSSVTDYQGNTISTTFGVFVLGPLGNRLWFPGETAESSAQFGVVKDFNDLSRSSVSVPLATNTTPGILTLDKDLGGVYNFPIVTGIQGNSVKSGTLGATQDGYVATWVNADSEIEFKSLGSITVDEATTTSLGTVQLAGDLGGNGTVGTAPKVKNVTGDSSGNVTISASTGTTTIGGAQDGYVIMVDASSDYIIDGYGHLDFIVLTQYSVSHQVHLPAPTSGRLLYITDAGGNLSTSVVLSVVPHAGEKIALLTQNYTMEAPLASITLISNGTDWFII